LPVLVSDQGGPQEVVRNGVTGRVLPSGRHDVWASAMAELLLDSPRRIAMGSVAHEVMRSMRIEDSFEHFWSLHDAACPPADRVGT
jgi:glycosyltransferase involved in cell wall biosynthesis